MDGTGDLFQPLLEQLPNSLDIEVIPLNSLEGNSYSEQINEIVTKLGNHPITLIAESYSGRIAYELARILRNQVVQIIFIASFITPPIFLCKIGQFLPKNAFNTRYLPRALLDYIGFSGFGDQELKNWISSVIQTVPSKTFHRRISNMANLSPPEEKLEVVTTYLRPTNDRLVEASAVKQLTKFLPKTNVINIEGGHFIAQTNPLICAQIIINRVVGA